MAAISDERAARSGRHPGYAHIGSPDSDDEEEAGLASSGGVEEGIPLRVRREGAADQHDPDSVSQLGAAYYDYEAKREGELSFERGSIIEIVDGNCENGWVRAKVDDEEGMVPSNYVILLGSQPNVIRNDELRRLEKIGSGGFSSVYNGLLREVQPVALKVPFTNPNDHNGGDDTDRVKKACLREALILSRLQTHPNIVGFYGICVEPIMELVMELCAGGTLFHLLRKMRSGSDARVALRWARQVAAAMRHLHTRPDPMVHADLKADNVLIKERPCECSLQDENWMSDEDGNYEAGSDTCHNCRGVKLSALTMKLTDFGLSRTLSDRRDSKLSIEGGSAAWSSPEVILENSYSEASDAWSFGVLLWEIYSCRLPYKDYENIYILYSVAYKEKTPRLPDDCPSVLREVFARCWKQLKDERAGFSELLHMLDRADEAVVQSRPTFKWKNREEPRRDPEREKKEIQNLTAAQLEQLFGGLHLPPSVAGGPPLLPAGRDARHSSLAGSSHLRGSTSALQKMRISKDQIGAPTDFQHPISITPSTIHAPAMFEKGHVGKRDKKGSGRELTLFNVKYLPETPLIVGFNPPPRDPQSSFPYHHLGPVPPKGRKPPTKDHQSSSRRDSKDYATLPRDFKPDKPDSPNARGSVGGSRRHTSRPFSRPPHRTKCGSLASSLGRRKSFKSNPELHKVHPMAVDVGVSEPPRKGKLSGGVRRPSGYVVLGELGAAVDENGANGPAGRALGRSNAVRRWRVESLAHEIPHSHSLSNSSSTTSSDASTLLAPRRGSSTPDATSIVIVDSRGEEIVELVNRDSIVDNGGSDHVHGGDAMMINVPASLCSPSKCGKSDAAPHNKGSPATHLHPHHQRQDSNDSQSLVMDRPYSRSKSPSPRGGKRGESQRKSSSPHSQSKFYIPSNGCAGPAAADSGEEVPVQPLPVSSFHERRSGSGSGGKQRFGHSIITTLSNLLPSNSAGNNRSSSTSVEGAETTDEGAGTSATTTTIQTAKCYHPHHGSQGSKESFIAYDHDCFNYSVDFVLQRRTHLPSNSHLPDPDDNRQQPPPCPPRLHFVKRHEQPAQQRQKHRTSTEPSSSSVSSPPPVAPVAVTLRPPATPPKRASPTSPNDVFAPHGQLGHHAPPLGPPLGPRARRASGSIGNNFSTLPAADRGSVLHKSIGMPTQSYNDLTSAKTSGGGGALQSPTISGGMGTPTVSTAVFHARSQSTGEHQRREKAFSTAAYQAAPGIVTNLSYVHMKQLLQKSQEAAKAQSGTVTPTTSGASPAGQPPHPSMSSPSTGKAAAVEPSANLAPPIPARRPRSPLKPLQPLHPHSSLPAMAQLDRPVPLPRRTSPCMTPTSSTLQWPTSVAPSAPAASRPTTLHLGHLRGHRVHDDDSGLGTTAERGNCANSSGKSHSTTPNTTTSSNPSSCSSSAMLGSPPLSTVLEESERASTRYSHLSSSPHSMGQRSAPVPPVPSSMPPPPPLSSNGKPTRFASTASAPTPPSASPTAKGMPRVPKIPISLPSLVKHSGQQQRK